MRPSTTAVSILRSIAIGSFFLLAATTRANTLVNYQPLQKAGLTGGGVTVQINAYGIKDLQGAENAGILDPSEIVVANPSATDNGAYPDRAVYSAIILHMVAPDANIFICNAAPDSCYGSDYSGAKIVVDEDADQVLSEDFSYGDTASDSRNLYHVSDFSANPNVLYYLSAGDIYGNDLYSENYFGGKWLPVAATVGGKAAIAWDFGAATGNNSDPEPIIFAYPTSSTAAPFNIDLQWEDPDSSDTPDFDIKVYSAGSNTLIADSVNGPAQCTSGHSLCAHIPQESYQTYPLDVYVINKGQPVLGDARLKMFFRPAPGIPTDPNYLPLRMDYVTGGSMTPFIPTAGPNAIVVKSGVEESGYSSSSGPELAFDKQTGQYKQFDYPTISGDQCFNIQQAPNMKNYFCGNAVAASELGGVAAMLLQAGLSPTQIESGEDETAVGYVGQPNSGKWNPENGYGYMAPLSVLTKAVSFATPKIYGPGNVEVQYGHSHTYYGLCTAAAGYVVTKYLWEFGDGTHAQGQTAVDTTHTFNNGLLGNLQTKLYCVEREPNGQSLTDVTPAQVSTDVFQNSSLAQLSAGTNFPRAGQALTFTATCMPTNTGTLTAWTLDFGDGSAPAIGKLGNYGSDFKVQHVYTKANAKGDFYTATLTCVQNQGQVTKGMSTVQVSASNSVATKSGGGGGLSIYALFVFALTGYLRWIRPNNQSTQRRTTGDQR